MAFNFLFLQSHIIWCVSGVNLLLPFFCQESWCREQSSFSGRPLLSIENFAYQQTNNSTKTVRGQVALWRWFCIKNHMNWKYFKTGGDIKTSRLDQYSASWWLGQRIAWQKMSTANLALKHQGGDREGGHGSRMLDQFWWEYEWRRPAHPDNSPSCVLLYAMHAIPLSGTVLGYSRSKRSSCVFYEQNQVRCQGWQKNLWFV